jgi:hypothetical protein
MLGVERNWRSCCCIRKSVAEVPVVPLQVVVGKIVWVFEVVGVVVEVCRRSQTSEHADFQ